MEVIKLNARVTLQQMLQREDFKNRVANGTEVRLHELQYPIMQGWDSVVVRSDVEIGGSDQLFNILVGRDLQKEEGMEPQVCMTLPLLEGLDGVKKMSKSLGNYVGLTDAPKEMFGKLMSIPDELMAKYYLLSCTASWCCGMAKSSRKAGGSRMGRARAHDVLDEQELHLDRGRLRRGGRQDECGGQGGLVFPGRSAREDQRQPGRDAREGPADDVHRQRKGADTDVVKEENWVRTFLAQNIAHSRARSSCTTAPPPTCAPPSCRR
jgi:hypothetical protein